MKKSVNNLLIFCFVFGITTQVDAFTFARSLTLGSTGQDVFELQKILNLSSQTQVAITGAGSPGQETTYFGDLTWQALIKFQNLYAPDILHPIGLINGTGFMGASTINFLNSKKYLNQNTIIESEASPEQNTQIETQATTQSQNPHQVALFYPMVTASHPGKYERGGYRNRQNFVDKDFMIGSGFEISNLNFYLDTQQLRKNCQNNYVCTLWIDKNTTPGTYTLSTSDPDFGTHQFEIVPMSVKYPEVTISRVKLLEDTLITGKNFTDTMIIHTPFGRYETVTLNDSFILNLSGNYIPDTSFSGIFYVENSYGLKSEVLLIQYEK